jgi:hypothetical protein
MSDKKDWADDVKYALELLQKSVKSAQKQGLSVRIKHTDRYQGPYVPMGLFPLEPEDWTITITETIKY